MALLLRYDTDTDTLLRFDIVRADEEGESIAPPILRLTDEATGERWTLDREQAWKLRDYIGRM